MSDHKQAGPYSSIQDKGRTGYQALGVPEGGAVDPDARIIANWLVGRPAETAGFEIFIGGLSFHTDTALAVALGGSLSDRLSITPPLGRPGKSLPDRRFIFRPVTALPSRLYAAAILCFWRFRPGWTCRLFSDL